MRKRDKGGWDNEGYVEHLSVKEKQLIGQGRIWSIKGKHDVCNNKTCGRNLKLEDKCQHHTL